MLDGQVAVRVERRRVIGLREDRAHDGGEGLAGALRHRREQIAHEVDKAALPRGAVEHRADRLRQPFVRVRDDQAHAGEVALHQAPQ
jgi:hypothetical protein